jgi:hypothetical protein
MRQSQTCIARSRTYYLHNNSALKLMDAEEEYCKHLTDGPGAPSRPFQGPLEHGEQTHAVHRMQRRQRRAYRRHRARLGNRYTVPEHFRRSLTARVPPPRAGNLATEHFWVRSREADH